jgi:hypothetical protein
MGDIAPNSNWAANPKEIMAEQPMALIDELHAAVECQDDNEEN